VEEAKVVLGMSGTHRHSSIKEANHTDDRNHSDFAGVVVAW
jgi:hypothetical protein